MITTTLLPCLVVGAVLLTIIVLWLTERDGTSRRAPLIGGAVLIVAGNVLALFFAVAATAEHMPSTLIEYGRQSFYILMAIGSGLMAGAIVRRKDD